MNVLGWRCATCDRSVDVKVSMPWRCPAADDDPHHVLMRVRALAPFRPNDHPNPFVRFDAELAWAAHADAHGLTFADRVGPLNMPLTLRATATQNDRPLVAEARLELVP